MGKIQETQIIDRDNFFPFRGKDQRSGRMGQVQLGVKKKVQRRPAKTIPEVIDHFHGKGKISKALLFKGGNLGSFEPILQRRRKEKVFVGTVDPRQGKKQILVIDSHTCLFLEERTEVKTDSHLE